MYALAICGSPRKEGNTELLLKEVLTELKDAGWETEIAYDTINHMFQMSRMIIPCSTYWNMGFGLSKGEVLEDDEGLANMRHLGKCIDWLGKAIVPNIESYPKGQLLQKTDPQICQNMNGSAKSYIDDFSGN